MGTEGTSTIHPMKKILHALASLRLTVVLLAMAMVLIFVGTLAQAHLGVWHVVDSFFRSPIAWIDFQTLIPIGLAKVPGSFPFPGGFIVGGLMIVNLLAAHAIRFKATRNRIGIVLLHAGVIVLLLGEFVTAFHSNEGMMSIDVGGSSNYVEDVREVELVVVDRSDKAFENVVGFSQARCANAAASGALIARNDLPFTIKIDRWFSNAQLLRATSPTPATHGVGLEAEPEELPIVRGVDGAETDTPAAYVTISREGKPLGTWLVSAGLLGTQSLEIPGQDIAIALRFRRTYKDYTLHLLEFNHDKFTGTEIPKNFSSRVRLVDPTRGTDREVLIWMNNPLRHAGETFYQASYKPDGSGTVLQVVHNPGALLPYLACLLVGVGMSIHFLISLTTFLRRRAASPSEIARAESAPTRRPLMPCVVGAVGILIACASLFRPSERSEFAIDKFARLPVSSGGRIKPMDTAARSVLMTAGGRQSVRDGGHTVSATEFLLDLISDPERVEPLPVVRVDHPDVLSILGRKPDEGGRIPLSAIKPHWAEISQQAQRVQSIPAKQRDPFQRAVVLLYDRVSTVLSHSSMLAPYMVPPTGPDGEWTSFRTAYMDAEAARTGVPSGAHLAVPNPALPYLVQMFLAFGDNDAPAFNQAVSAYDEIVQRDMPGVMRRADLEILFNRAELFLGAIRVYVLSFLLVCGGVLLRMRGATDGTKWGPTAEKLRVAATALLISGWLVHTIAIVLRIYLQERPPVTNLYSSAVFVGWAAVAVGIILERIHRIGIGALGSAAVGFATLVIAHNLGNDGDTMQMMQAVLDSNFWLATHVVVITLGYSATFLAGTLALIYLMMGVFTKHLNAERGRTLTRMVYGVVCFAMLLSFVGTVLGGIWADQSWGRFWGWDPKENGAALIVLINAIILHARWGGLVKERGIMVLAVAGNIVTAWSWFGTNMLGVGLHSYGFMDSAVMWLMVFVASQLVVMSIGLTPLSAWRSRDTPAQ
jgi:ABC-type transport system involved in cytochrome c biogenesis permease subunit